MATYKGGKGRQTQEAAEKKYKASQKGRAALKRSIETRNLKYPERVKARALVSRALKSGALAKWPVCAIPSCSEAKVEAHHPDYSRPLNVVWLCDKHHAEVHYA